MAFYLMPTAALFVVSAGVTLSEIVAQELKHLFQIFVWGLGFAFLSFGVGFFVPVFLSSSPSGALMGIFLGGPAGAIFGCVWGALRSVREAKKLAHSKT